MPRSRALRSTVEIATSFSTLTAITSTPRVIQASTTSFCLAGSRSVGPSQSSSTPSLAGRFLGALAAADEVGIALGLGHHARRRACARPRARRASSRARSAELAQLLPQRAHQRASCSPATISSAAPGSPRSERRLVSSLTSFLPVVTAMVPASLRGSAATGGRAGSWRRAAHPSGCRPAPRAAPLSRSPFCRITIAKSPSTVPSTVPRPPKIDAPPSTTAVIAISS